MPQQFWLVSLPLQNNDSKEDTWRRLHLKLSEVAPSVENYRLHVPELRVGTLDSLLELSDELSKANSVVEGVSTKIKRQLDDLDRVAASSASSSSSSAASFTYAAVPTAAPLTVDGVAIDTYVTKFSWDEAKYPLMAPLKETVEVILDTVAKLEEDMKVRVSEYNNVKGQLNAMNRKAGGSLLVRDLASLVQPQDVVNTEHMVTLLVVVSKYSEADWLASYERMAAMVVPRSSKRLVEDSDYALFTVTLFKKVVDEFKVSARDKGFQVREYELDPEAASRRQEEQARLAEDQESMRTTLHQWCHVSFGEVFSSWLHLCVIRLFAESILRYGLAPGFTACVLAPAQKDEKRLRSLLDSFCESHNKSFWKGAEGDAGMAGLSGGDSDFHPYVSYTIGAPS